MATRWGETFRVTTDGVQMHNIFSYFIMKWENIEFTGRILVFDSILLE